MADETIRDEIRRVSIKRLGGSDVAAPDARMSQIVGILEQQMQLTRMQSEWRTKPLEARPEVKATIRQQFAGLGEKQAVLEQQQLDLARERISVESEWLRITRQKLLSGKTEYNRPTAREQDKLPGALQWPDHFESTARIRDAATFPGEKSAFFTMLAQEREKGAESRDAGRIFAEIQQRSGPEDYLAGATATQAATNRNAILKINELHIMDALNISIDPGKVASDMASKVAPLIQDAIQRTALKLNDELARATRIAEGARSRAGLAGAVP